MNHRRGILAPLLSSLNRTPGLPIQVKVWGNGMFAYTADRLLYLLLHKASLMGGDSKTVLERSIKPGMFVLDVGANIGLYTGLLSTLVGPGGRVAAVEPDPLNWHALENAIDCNGWGNVESCNCALHERSCSLALVHDPCHSGNHSISNAPEMLRKNQTIVAGRTLDDVVGNRHVDFIKIDVQGWEIKVLRGAGKTLAAGLPLTLLVEVWPAGLRRNGESAEELLDMLRDFKFVLFDPLSREPFIDAPKRGYTDVLAVRC